MYFATERHFAMHGFHFLKSSRVSKRKTIYLMLFLCALVALSSIYAIFSDTFSLTQTFTSGTVTLDQQLYVDGTPVDDSTPGIYLNWGDIRPIEVHVTNNGSLDARLQVAIRLEFPPGTDLDSIQGVYLYDGSVSAADIKSDTALDDPTQNLLGEIINFDDGGGRIINPTFPTPVSTDVFHPLPITPKPILSSISKQKITTEDIGFITLTNTLIQYTLPLTDNIIPAGESRVYKAQLVFALNSADSAQGLRGNIYSAVSGIQARNTDDSMQIDFPGQDQGDLSDVWPTGISLDKSAITINGLLKGVLLTPTISPADANDRTVNWSSSNKNVATVDANGNVISRGAGQATITAADDSGDEAYCTVTVTP